MNHSSLEVFQRERLVRRIRFLTWFFIFGLIVSGATAIPLNWELDILARMFGITNSSMSELGQWLVKVRSALNHAGSEYPFLFYGTDWLAFGHFAIAIAFVGPLLDPVRNRWIFTFGLLVCVLVIPYALIFGALRGIPFWWRCIDCSFG